MSNTVVCCPNGHRLCGSADMQGRRVQCPKCKVKFEFQLPQVKKSLTETGVLRILGDVAPLPMPPETPPKTLRNCPRCERLISVKAHVCSHCQCYVGDMPYFLRQMTQQAHPHHN